MTIVGPLLFAGISVIPVLLAMKTKTQTIVSVIDHSGLFAGKLKSNKETVFQAVTGDLASQKKLVQDSEGNRILLVIGPTDGTKVPDVVLFGESNPSLDLVSSVENKIGNELKSIQLKASGIDPQLVEKIDPEVNIQTKVLSDGGEKEGSSVAATAAGYGAGILIYIFIFLYGSMVMTGVMEEKTSRVVEVLISSVKPFQLMMGKIVGVALVGLTQFVLWLVLSYGITTVTGAFLLGKSSDNKSVTQDFGQAGEQKKVEKAMEKSGFFHELSKVNLPLIASCFVFFFLGGYLLYGALFASVGAAVDNQQEAQQFMFPITIPIIASFILAQVIIKEPNGTMAFWFSMIPFTSPIIMMVRIPFEPPIWQIVLSMICLVLGFLATTWFAAKIYRVGILMYGKKITYKELYKWMTY